MKKGKFLISLLSAGLALGLLGGCTLGGETPAGSSIEANSSAVAVSSTTTNSSATTTETEIDLTYPVKTVEKRQMSDDEILSILKAFSKRYETVADIPAQAKTLLQSLIGDSGFTAENVNAFIALVKKASLIPAVDTYHSLKIQVASIIADVKTLLAAVDADQIGHALYAYAQFEFSESVSSNGLPLRIEGLETLEDFNAVLGKFADVAGFGQQFTLYAPYFNADISYVPKTPDMTITLEECSLFARLFKLALTKILDNFDSDFLTAIFFGFVIKGTAFSKDALKDIQAVEANPTPYINIIGKILGELNLTKATVDILRTKAVEVAKSIIGVSFTPLRAGQTVSLSQKQSIITFVDRLQNAVTADEIKAVFKLVSYAATSLDKTTYDAILAAGQNGGNPSEKLVALFDQAFAKLTLAEKESVKKLFENLGLSYDTIYQTVSGWKDLDFSEKGTGAETVRTFLQATGAQVLTSLAYPASASHDYYLSVPSYAFKDEAITADRIKASVYGSSGTSDNPDQTTYTVKNIVADVSSYGFHVGSFTLSSNKGTSEDFQFGYYVCPIAPRIVNFFLTSSLEDVFYSHNTLCLPKGTSQEAFNSSMNGSSFFYYPADSYIGTNVDSGFSISFDATTAGEGYALITYLTAGTDIPVYGVIKTYVYEANELHKTFSDNVYVIQNGTTLLHYSVYLEVEGEYFYETMSRFFSMTELGCATDVLGKITKKTELGDATYTVVPLSSCEAKAIIGAEYTTVYTPGQKFSLTSIDVEYDYVNEAGDRFDAGMLLVENPTVEDLVFDNSAPVDQSSVQRRGSFTYQGVTYSFSYTVVAAPVAN